MSAKRELRPARRSLGDRGAVYVEFLIVFMPLFLLFLAVCQLALLAAARLVVQHAALSGARSAIVVLEDDPNRYGRAPRGSLSNGRASAAPSIEHALASLGLRTTADSGLGSLYGALAGEPPQGQGPQQGARMTSIRQAAEFPLLALAPMEDTIVRPKDGSVASSLGASVAGQLIFALAYTRAAAVITVHVSGSDELASDPVARDAAVSVRVTYLYACGVPIVRALLCRSLDSLLGWPHPSSLFGALLGANPTALGKRFDFAEDRGGLQRLAKPGSFFAPLGAEATLPNQGAAYEHKEGK